MTGTKRGAAMALGVAILALACISSCAAKQDLLGRRMAMAGMGNMTAVESLNMTGSSLTSADGKLIYTIANRGAARKAYPWCVTSTTTAYFLEPKITMGATTSSYIEYDFHMDENYDLCKEVLTRKNKAGDINRLCNTPFYSFMIAVSMECHEAIMSVQTIQMFATEDKAGATKTEMYCHAHKGHDTGVPLLKYLIKPKYLTPTVGVKRSFVLTVRVNMRKDNKCQDIQTLCGGPSCMVALSDEEYNTCPAFNSVMPKMHM